MKTPKEDRTRVRESVLTVVLTESEKQMIEDKAHELGITMSTLARMAIVSFIKREGT